MKKNHVLSGKIRNISVLFVMAAMIINCFNNNFVKIEAVMKMSLNFKTTKYIRTNQTSKVKKTQTIQVKNLSSQNKVSWKSNNKKLATVKAGKKGKAKLTVSLSKVGTAKITATIRSKKNNKKVKIFTKEVSVVNKIMQEGATAKPTLTPTKKPTLIPTDQPMVLGEKNESDVKILTGIITEQRANGASVSEDLDSSQYGWSEETGKLIEICWGDAGGGYNLKGSLDVSGLTSLTHLSCIENQLTSLKVGGLTSLKVLYCGSNQLTSLEVSSLTSLRGLSCGGNQLTSLEVSGLTSLTYLSCGGNQLTSLEVSGLPSLTYLSCSGNQLTSLEVSGLTSLKDLYCRGNKLTFLDIRGLFNLEQFDCDQDVQVIRD